MMLFPTITTFEQKFVYTDLGDQYLYIIPYINCSEIYVLLCRGLL